MLCLVITPWMLSQIVGGGGWHFAKFLPNFINKLVIGVSISFSSIKKPQAYRQNGNRIILQSLRFTICHPELTVISQQENLDTSYCLGLKYFNVVWKVENVKIHTVNLCISSSSHLASLLFAIFRKFSHACSIVFTLRIKISHFHLCKIFLSCYEVIDPS